MQLRKYGSDLDLTPNFDGDLELATSVIGAGHFPIPVAGAYVRSREDGLYYHIVAAWTAGNL